MKFYHNCSLHLSWTCPSMIKTYVIKTDEYALVGGAPTKRPTFLHPTGLAYRYLLSCIPPVLHPSCLASLLSCIPPVLHPTCLASHLSCIRLNKTPAGGEFLHFPMSCIPPVLDPSCLGSLPLALRSSCPASIVSRVFLHPYCPASILFKITDQDLDPCRQMLRKIKNEFFSNKDQDFLWMSQDC